MERVCMRCALGKMDEISAPLSVYRCNNDLFGHALAVWNVCLFIVFLTPLASTVG